MSFVVFLLFLAILSPLPSSFVPSLHSIVCPSAGDQSVQRPAASSAVPVCRPDPCLPPAGGLGDHQDLLRTGDLH